jgi:hypothetical protein
MQSRGGFGRVLEAIQNSINDHRTIRVPLIINGVGKTTGQSAMETKNPGVNSTIMQKNYF